MIKRITHLYIYGDGVTFILITHFRPVGISFFLLFYENPLRRECKFSYWLKCPVFMNGKVRLVLWAVEFRFCQVLAVVQQICDRSVIYSYALVNI